MTDKSELQHLESECAAVSDWINLARRALEEPADREYAATVASNAEMDCQDPADYVKLAQFYKQELGIDDYVGELLEQAEDACFESMEYAEVGCAYATLTPNADKGISLIREAAESASGSGLVQLADYAERAGDGELATSLLSQATSDLKELGQYLELARSLAGSGNNEAAQRVLKSGERHVQTVADTVQLAATSVELSESKDRARELLENAELDCQFPADYTTLAKGFVEILNAEDKVDELLAQAADLAMEGEEFLDVAYGYMVLKDDGETALSHFRQALPDISDRGVLQEIARTSATQLGNQEFARECYERIAAKLTGAGDLVKLAVDSWNTLQDPEYTKQKFAAAKAKMANANDLVALAESVIQTLNDQDLVRSIYRDAGSLVDSFSGLERILKSQCESVDDAELTLELLTRMKSLASNCKELISAFYLARDSAQKTEFCHTLLSSAEDFCASPADLESVIAAVQSFVPDDEAWLSNLADKLTRRQANQAKYADIEAQQKKADSPLSFMRLAKRAVTELDDHAYARNLLDEALAGMTDQEFDISLWLTVIEITVIHLEDIELIHKYAMMAATACTHFSSAYMLVQKLNKLLKEPDRAVIINQIFSDWEVRLSTVAESIKLAKSLLITTGNREKVGNILDSIDATEPTLLQLIELAEIANHIDDQNKAEEFYLTAADSCQNASDFDRLMSRLQSSEAGRKQRKVIYETGGDKLTDVLERLRWTEGIVLYFNDIDWARTEYDRLDAEISDGAMRSACLASRRQRLEKKFY